MKAKGYSRKAIVVFCLLVFAFFFSLQDVTSIFSHRVNYSDSGVYQYIGSSLLRGEVLYRDNFDHFGPVLYIINALGFAIAKIHGVGTNCERECAVWFELGILDWKYT